MREIDCSRTQPNASRAAVIAKTTVRMGATLGAASAPPPDEQLWAGAQVIRGIHPEYDSNHHPPHTLALVRSTLKILEETHGVKLLDPFSKMLFFDAWIGNGDRHCENWGLVIATAGVRLAPMYDPAACLGAELQAAQVDKTRTNLERYILGCPSGFGNEKELIGQTAVVRALWQWPEWQTSVNEWLAGCDALLAQVRHFLQEIPDFWLPQQRRNLACELLEARLKWLKEHLSDEL